MAGWTVVPNHDTSAWTPVAPAGNPPKPYVPQPGDGSISAAPEPSIMERLRGTVANSAIGHSLEQVLPKIADALNLHPTETVNSPTSQSDKQNIIAPQYLMPGNPQTQQGQKVKALLTGAGNLTNPKVAAMGAGIGAAAGLAAPLAPALIPSAIALGGIGMGGGGAVTHAIQAHTQYSQGNTDAGNDATSKIPTDLLMLLGGLKGASSSADAIPSQSRAGQVFQSLNQELAEHPVNLNNALAPLQRAIEIGTRGSNTPAAVSALLQRSQAIEPMTFPEARDYQSSLSDLSTSDKLAMNNRMRGAVAQLNKNFYQDVLDSADQAGRGEDFAGAMKEYRQASQIKNVANKFGKYAIGAGGLGTAYGIIKEAKK